ncbi:MAG: type IV secretory system conjugative DNA transfer family protein [Bdellovibrio sp.]
MSKAENSGQDFEKLALPVVALAVTAIVLFLIVILLPAITMAFLLTETFLYLSFKNERYICEKKQLIQLGIAICSFILLISIPITNFTSYFRGFLFIVFDHQIAWLIKWLLTFVNKILPKPYNFSSVTGISLRLYLWTAWPFAGALFFIKIKKGIRPIFAKRRSDRLTYKTNNYIQIGHYKGRFFNSAFNITYDMLKHHLHVLGASGFGKSVFLFHIVSDLIRKNRGLMFVDLKADIDTVRQVVALAKKSERLDKLKFFSCANPEISTHYNILGRGNANQLTDRIISSLIWSEEFYKNESKSILMKVLIPLVWIRDNTSYKPHLGNLLEAIKNPDYLSELKNQLTDERYDILIHLEEVDRYLRNKDNYKNLQGLRTQLEAILLTDFGSKLCPARGYKVIDIYEAVKNTEVIYFLLDSRRYSESAKSLGRMILEDLKAASGEIDGTISPSKRQAFNIIIDEFADMASADFISFLDRARSSGMGTVVAHQEISDLKSISPETADRLMHLTSTTVSFLTKLPESAEKIAAMAGTKTSWKITEKAQYMFGLLIKSGDVSLREVEEFNLHPNTLKKLTVGEAVAIGKYPSSTSGVVKINPPEKLLLSEEDFQIILKSIENEINKSNWVETPLATTIRKGIQQVEY